MMNIINRLSVLGAQKFIVKVPGSTSAFLLGLNMAEGFLTKKQQEGEGQKSKGQVIPPSGKSMIWGKLGPRNHTQRGREVSGHTHQL